MSFMIKMAGETFRNAILEDHSTCIYTICTLIVNRTHLISILVWQYYKLYHVVLKKNTLYYLNIHSYVELPTPPGLGVTTIDSCCS